MIFTSQNYNKTSIENIFGKVISLIMHKKLTIGIFGIGYLGKIHLRCLLELQDFFHISGFYDPDDEVKVWMSQNYPHIPYFHNPQDLIFSSDCIDIVSPTITHYEIAKKCIEARKNFFLEKPVCHSLLEAITLREEILQNNLKVQVGFVERYNPAYLAIQKKDIQAHFIEAHRLSSFQSRGTDTSVVIDLMIHDLDILISMVKSPIAEIHANGVSLLSNFTDIANARIVFSNGAVANLTASRVSINAMRKFRIFSDEAYLSLDFLNKKTELIRLFDQQNENNDRMMVELKDRKRFLEIEIPSLETNNAIKNELFDFYQCIIQEIEPTISIVDGVNALALAIEIQNRIDASNYVK